MKARAGKLILHESDIKILKSNLLQNANMIHVLITYQGRKFATMKRPRQPVT